jgi:hypothetical protein
MRLWRCLSLLSTAMAGMMASPVQAGFYSGNDLLEACATGRESSAYFEKSYECVAYVAGAVDAFNTTREINKLKSCIPSGVTIGQLRTVTVDYLRANPNNLNGAASGLIFSATRKAWPCKMKAASKARRTKRK